MGKIDRFRKSDGMSKSKSAGTRGVLLVVVLAATALRSGGCAGSEGSDGGKRPWQERTGAGVPAVAPAFQPEEDSGAGAEDPVATSGEGPIIIEAAHMALEGYEAEDYSKVKWISERCSLRRGIRLRKDGPSAGTATSTFSGPSGRYTVTVVAIPEDDGAPSIRVYVGASKIIEAVYYHKPKDRTFTVREELTVKGVQIDSGDQIRIEGARERNAWARVNKIIIQRETDRESSVLPSGRHELVRRVLPSVPPVTESPASM